MIKKQGFVAMVDVLGFADRVARDSEVGGLDKYIDTVVRLAQPFFNLGTILFSDTVVLYTFDDSPAAYDDIIALTSRLSFALLLEEVPLRGAIAHGSFVRSEQEAHGTVIAGRPIIEAHSYEVQLQWIGVMLTPSVLRHLPDLATLGPLSGPGGDEDRDAYFARVRRAAQVQRCSKIPVEPFVGAPVAHLEGFGIVPLSGNAATPSDIKDSVSQVLAKLRWLKQLAPDPRSQMKYQNSIAWLEELYHYWIPSLR